MSGQGGRFSSQRPASPAGHTDRPDRRYTIEVVAALCGVRIGTLRHYERLGLVQPKRNTGSHRWYTDADVERVRQIQRLTNDLGVNLAAVEVILHMRERMLELHRELATLRHRLGMD